MKTHITIFFTLSLVSLFGGLFGTTPLGEPATHQFYVSGFCWFLTVAFIIEHFKIKLTNKGKNGIKRDNI